MWKSVKRIVGLESSGPPTRLIHEAKSISSPSGLASTMNKFFINKVKGLRSAIPQVETDPLANLRESLRKRPCTFNLKLVNEQDVMKIINSLNNSSSTGVDFIDAPTIKLVRKQILPAVTKIINLSIQTLVFPSI